MRLLERRLMLTRRRASIGRAEAASSLESKVEVQQIEQAPRAACLDATAQPSKSDDTGTSPDQVTQATAAKPVKKSKTSCSQASDKLKRQLNAINSIGAIKLKILFLVAAHVGCGLLLAEAGFCTFYFPNIFKPKGFGELTDMIRSIENQINETKDAFADSRYFWGQLQKLDEVPPEQDYPEDSACDEVFPLFRDLAINYIFIDYEFYLKPLELYREHMIEVRDKWYPAGLESKAALPRQWEQELMEKELDLKIEWLDKLTNKCEHRNQREKMLDIWKSVRRGLDNSVPCVKLRYAYRQIAQDINQLALEANLEAMREAMEVLKSAYKRIKKFKSWDKKIMEEIQAEITKLERFTIK